MCNLEPNLHPVASINDLRKIGPSGRLGSATRHRSEAATAVLDATGGTFGGWGRDAGSIRYTPLEHSDRFNVLLVNPMVGLGTLLVGYRAWGEIGCWAGSGLIGLVGLVLGSGGFWQRTAATGAGVARAGGV